MLHLWHGETGESHKTECGKMTNEHTVHKRVVMYLGKKNLNYGILCLL